MHEVNNFKPRHNDDEIDRVERILDLWKGRILTPMFVVLFSCFGFVYAKYFAKAHYSVSTS